MGEAIPCTGDKEPFALKGCPLGECKAPEAWQAFFFQGFGDFFLFFFGGWMDVGMLNFWVICFLLFLGVLKRKEVCQKACNLTLMYFCDGECFEHRLNSFIAV